MADSQESLTASQADALAGVDQVYEDALDQGTHQRSGSVDGGSAGQTGNTEQVAEGVLLGGGARIGSNPAFRNTDNTDNSAPSGSGGGDGFRVGGAFSQEQHDDSFDDDDDDDLQSQWQEWSQDKNTTALLQALRAKQSELDTHLANDKAVEQVFKTYAEAHRSADEEVRAEHKATHDKIQSYTAEEWWKDLTWKDCELFSTVLEAKARELSFDNIRRDLLTEVHELEQLVHQKAEEEAKVRAAKRIATAKRSMGGPTKKKRSGKSPMFYRAS
jgi:hypothetical protein